VKSIKKHTTQKALSLERSSPKQNESSSGRSNYRDFPEFPVRALLLHTAVYAALVTFVHAFVLFAFSKESLQLNLAGWFSTMTIGFVSADSIKHMLIVTNVKQHVCVLSIPTYVIAGLMLKFGIRNAIHDDTSKCGRADIFAANIARVVSSIAFISTVVAYTKWDQNNSWEGLNALVVLEFGFMFQEFLLNYPRFTVARTIYSILYLIVTGYQSGRAFHFKAHITTSPQAPPIDVALAYALSIVNTSDNLAALAGVFAGLGLSTAATASSALQSVVNTAVTLIMSASIYHKYTLLFPYENELKQPTFLESSIAVLIMCGLIFLLLVDSFFVPFTRARVRTTTARTSEIAETMK
jgi:hypothetical protein